MLDEFEKSRYATENSVKVPQPYAKTFLGNLGMPNSKKKNGFHDGLPQLAFWGGVKNAFFTPPPRAGRGNHFGGLL